MSAAAHGIARIGFAADKSSQAEQLHHGLEIRPGRPARCREADIVGLYP